jgi:hypothetical protein
MLGCFNKKIIYNEGKGAKTRAVEMDNFKLKNIFMLCLQ